MSPLWQGRIIWDRNGRTPRGFYGEKLMKIWLRITDVSKLEVISTDNRHCWKNCRPVMTILVSWCKSEVCFPFCFWKLFFVRRLCLFFRRMVFVGSVGWTLMFFWAYFLASHKDSPHLDGLKKGNKLYTIRIRHWRKNKQIPDWEKPNTSLLLSSLMCVPNRVLFFVGRCFLVWFASASHLVLHFSGAIFCDRSL